MSSEGSTCSEAHAPLAPTACVNALARPPSSSRRALTGEPGLAGAPIRAVPESR